MSVLARNNCYILPYCQGTEPCGKVKYFAKYSLTPLLPVSLVVIQTGIVEYFRK